MSGFLYRLGRACYRGRGRTLLAWLVVLLLAGAGALLLRGQFNDEFKLPGSQSMVALDQLNQTFPQMSGTSATMIVEAPEGKRVDEPASKTAIQDSVAAIGKLPNVTGAVDPFSPYVTGAISSDGRAGLATVQLKGSVSEQTDAQRAALRRQAQDLQAKIPGSTVRMGGPAFSAAMPKLSAVEVLGVGVALIVLFFTLGSALAAGLPVLTAIVGVGISMALLVMSTRLVDINSSSPMLALMLGLAVGIDYALFILSRHRDQLATGMDAEESTARSVATAGSAVVFAGATVVIALLGLFICNIPFLATMGFFAAIAVAIAVCVALTLVPAFMGFLGDRMRPKRRRRGAAAADSAAAQGATRAAGDQPGGGLAAAPAKKRFDPSAWWVGVATKVPALTVALVVLLLGLLAIPAKDMQLALPNAGQHARTSPERQTYDLIAKTFGPGHNGPLIITASLVQSHDPLGLMNGLKQEMQGVEGVAAVPLATPNPTADTGVLEVIPTTGPDDPQTTKLVKQLRADIPQWEQKYGTKLAVTGSTAVQIDVTDQLGAALLPFGIFVVGLSVVLLTMVFRSIFVPIKAALGYLLSVASAFGITTLVFNRGVLRQVINLEDPVRIISFFPIIFMGILFGLAMDYEVFLVSRMREDHVHGMEARAAVKSGFVHSAKVVVAAALIMFSVFAFFVPEGDATLKPIAFGLALGVAIDAFLVRMTLVPAVMTLAGEKAWWLPRWLDRALPSFDVEGEGLAHQLKYADWPTPGDRHAIYAEGLAVEDEGASLLAPTSLAVAPGEVARVTGPSTARAALLLALAGKLAPSAGEAKVGGALLSTQAGDARRRVSYVDAHTPNPARVLEAARGVVLVDDADRVAAVAPEALRRLLEAPGERAVVLAAAEPASLQVLGGVPGSSYALGERLDDGFAPAVRADAAAAPGRRPAEVRPVEARHAAPVDDRPTIVSQAPAAERATHGDLAAADDPTQVDRVPWGAGASTAVAEQVDPAPRHAVQGEPMTTGDTEPHQRAAGLSALQGIFERQQDAAEREGERR